MQNEYSLEDRPLSIRYTGPDTVFIHKITDGELDRLTEGNTSWWEGLQWVLIGGAIGLFVDVLKAWHGYLSSPSQLLTVEATLKSMVFGVCTCTAAVIFFIEKPRKSSAYKLRDQIRAR